MSLRNAPLLPLAIAIMSATAALSGCNRSGDADASASIGSTPQYDLLIRNGTVYDGSGGAPQVADVAISADRIVAIGRAIEGKAAREIDATGLAVAPGFINVLSWANESMLEDGRAQSDLRQGVTLEIFGEGSSMGPWNERMKANYAEDRKSPATWNTLGEYLDLLASRGIAPNVASFVGAATVRRYVLGEDDVTPDAAQLQQMQGLVRDAMQDGALGVGSSLIYVPATFAKTDELTALAQVAGQCGGMYITHMRSETDHILEAVDETIQIARDSGAPAEIYHLKIGGKANWDKLDPVVARIDAARASGVRITTDMYPYPASATGLDASMPPWVREGGYDAWAARLRDPAVRKRVIAEMRAPENDWENLFRAVGGPQNMLLVAFRNPALQPLVGKTLAEVAAMRGTSAEDTAMDLVIEDGTRVGVAYFGMSEDNQKRQMQLPYMSFGSDGPAITAEGDNLKSNPHPRAYGTFARILGHYVRDEKVLTLTEAIHRMTSLPAQHLSLRERGLLQKGYMADVVVFDPATIKDHSTFEDPHHYATGVSTVVINGVVALDKGEPTGAASGRVVHGRGWSGWPDGGCRATPGDWTWADPAAGKPAS
ncbi:N-acyl-D-amino-acid deacylase family protein [Luteimonas sp. RIT-PG2_3]